MKLPKLAWNHRFLQRSKMTKQKQEAWSLVKSWFDSESSEYDQSRFVLVPGDLVDTYLSTPPLLILPKLAWNHRFVYLWINLPNCTFVFYSCLLIRLILRFGQLSCFLDTILKDSHRIKVDWHAGDRVMFPPHHQYFVLRLLHHRESQAVLRASPALS
mgnify:CR=1 FL=1